MFRVSEPSNPPNPYDLKPSLWVRERKQWVLEALAGTISATSAVPTALNNNLQTPPKK